MVNKVVLCPSVGGGTDLRISQVSTAFPARTPAGSELHLGSQDLIRFASYACVHGFTVSSFMLADAYLVPLNEDEQAEISAEMVRSLNQYGEDELEASLRDEHAGVYVIGVNLIEPSTGMRISIRRRGYIETSIVQEAEKLLESAWRELRLT
ncbi:hypothetical protein SB659_10495 [Arthrobacter sp. SIMBA_036]|uniref:hypothetical protein n=1 Tax=Arthrobacter sp. SIMBA_036 TaxID=3085778 RepID=UPI003979C763